MNKPTIAEIEAALASDPSSVTIKPDGRVVWTPAFDARVRQSVVILLRNLTKERPGWRRYLFGRWEIADEPLRRDAAALLFDIEDGE